MRTKNTKTKGLFLDVKPGIRYHLILSTAGNITMEADRIIYEQEAKKLIGQLLDQQHLAIRLEKEGKINDAVLVYEKLVADQIDDVHSYHRLFQYYSQNGKPEQVHRICTAYIEMTYALEAIGVMRKDLMSLRDVFSQYTGASGV